MEASQLAQLQHHFHLSKPSQTVVCVGKYQWPSIISEQLSFHFADARSLCHLRNYNQCDLTWLSCDLSHVISCYPAISLVKLETGYPLSPRELFSV
jgi:hypothetical protein